MSSSRLEFVWGKCTYAVPMNPPSMTVLRKYKNGENLIFYFGFENPDVGV